MKKQDPVYDILVNGLRVVASPYERQKKFFPEFVHLPDEVINAVEYIYAKQLRRNKMISEKVYAAFEEYDLYLDTMPTFKDYSEAVIELEKGSWFNELRRKAVNLLELMDEPLVEPKLDNITFVRGDATRGCCRTNFPLRSKIAAEHRRSTQS